MVRRLGGGADGVSRGARAFARTASSSTGRRLRNGVLSGVLLSVLLGGVVLAVPGLHGVSQTIRHARPGWVALAAGLELASCVGYVLAFQGTFEHLPRRFAAMVAASEQAFGAVVPVGGAGGIAAGGWLLARHGIPLARIAERSAVLFLLTSATNVVALLVAAGGLAADWFAGPHDVVRAGVPATVALAVLLVFVALAWWALVASEHRGPTSGWRPLRALGEATVATLQLVRRPGWRVAVGAPAYLLCDVAVLWLCLHALGCGVPAAPLLVAYLLGYLANAVPIPGGVGVLDGGLAAALVAYHVPAVTAAGGVLIYHALALWIPTASGTLAFVAVVRHRVPARTQPSAEIAQRRRCPEPPRGERAETVSGWLELSTKSDT